jgi:hypothetical protein
MYHPYTSEGAIMNLGDLGIWVWVEDPNNLSSNGYWWRMS